MESSTYLQPRMDTPDAEFASVRTFGAERLKRRGTEMSIEVFVNPPNANEHYLLIYADPQHLGDKDVKTTSESRMIYVGTGFFIAGDDKATLRSSTTGRKLTLTLVGEQWDRALKDAKNHR